MPKPKPLPSQQELQELLDYDPETGTLTWKRRSVELFAGTKTPNRAKSLCALWNQRYAGTEALTFVGDGYRLGAINGVLFKAHRVIWKMVHGVDPLGVGNDINGDRCDNRLENLRSVPLIENARNRRIPSNNKSGVIGVYLWEQDGYKAWAARVGHKHYRYFKTFEEAVAARKAAEATMDLHENHGRARRTDAPPPIARARRVRPPKAPPPARIKFADWILSELKRDYSDA